MHRQSPSCPASNGSDFGAGWTLHASTPPGSGRSATGCRCRPYTARSTPTSLCAADLSGHARRSVDSVDVSSLLMKRKLQGKRTFIRELDYTFIKSKRTMNMRYSFTSIRNIRNKLRPVPLFLRLNRYWFEFSLFHSSVSSILMFHVLCFVRSNNVSCQPFSLFFCLASFLVCIS